MNSWDAVWPWIGMLAALCLLAGLLFTDRFHSQAALSRWHDLQWLAWLAAPVYMLHQFDEYAVFYDYSAGKSAFADAMCQRLGYPPYPDCPLPAAHFWLINIALAWLLIPLAAACCKRSPVVALAPWGVIFVNGCGHLAAWLISGLPMLAGHNSGVLTACLLFLPLSAWVAYAGLKSGAIPPRLLGLIVATGGLAHLLLLTAFASFRLGGAALMFAVDIAALALPLPAAWLVERLLSTQPLEEK